MKQMIKTIIISIILITCSSSLFAKEYEKSVVRIRITTQQFDYYSPWQRKGHKTDWKQGCVLDTESGLIVTLSLPLENHIFVEVSKFGEQSRYPAEVLLKDYETGLAFLTVPYKEFFHDLESAQLPEQRTDPSKGTVVKWDSRGRFKSYPAELFATSIQSYEGLGGALIHQMITGLDSGGDGEPVFQGDYLIGITAWFDQDKKTIKVNSAETIKWMLADISDGKYSGQPAFWLDTLYLQGDENLKTYLGMNKSDTGILVLSIPPEVSGYKIIQRNDVILAIDGIDIDDNGLCSTSLYGKLNYMWLIILNHVVGEIIEIHIIRNGVKQILSFPLLQETEETLLIPSYYQDRPPLYYIEGGLLFQELTRGYMAIWGNDWENKADKRLAFYTKNFWIYPSDEKKRVVILNRVLPATVNQGYHDMENQILSRINGKEVRDIKHMQNLIEDVTEEFIVFEFLGNENIVLKKISLENETDAILKQYSIESRHN